MSSVLNYKPVSLKSVFKVYCFKKNVYIETIGDYFFLCIDDISNVLTFIFIISLIVFVSNSN